MNNIDININWEFFLSITSSIVAIAYYASGRFTRLETTVQWLSDAVRELTIKAENISRKLFDAASPVSLTATGYRFLEDSGLKSYIDDRRAELVATLHLGTRLDLYHVQETAFHLLARMSFDDSFTQHFNRFAFRNGVSADLLRRLGAIYLRDIVAPSH